jgi:hypothetical protein
MDRIEGRCGSGGVHLRTLDRTYVRRKDFQRFSILDVASLESLLGTGAPLEAGVS